MSERAHLSIGEVLSLLRAEFPDITISKIRFLESQGLLDPERTPSGYRKFYEEDVERLRWILRQQRENFLPLKVIKGRLSRPESAELEAGSWPPDLAGEETAPMPAVSVGNSAAERATGHSEAREGRRGAAATLFGDPSEEVPASQMAQPGAVGQPAEVAPVAATPGPAADSRPPTEAAPPAAVTSARRAGDRASPRPAVAAAADAPSPAASVGTVSPVPASVPSHSASGGPRASRSAAGRTARPPLGEASGEVNLTVEELAASCGLPVERVRELERFGLLVSRDVGGTAYYGDEAQAVAVLAAGFASHGVEARHLRMYKNSAERESGLFEQIVMPLIKQRNPQARLQAAAAIEELSRLGGELRETLLRRSLRDAL